MVEGEKEIEVCVNVYKMKVLYSSPPRREGSGKLLWILLSSLWGAVWGLYFF